MKYLWTTLQVNDMERSLKFYRDLLGLPINRRFSTGPNSEICFLGEGETKLELICSTEAEIDQQLEGISIGFQIDSIDRKMSYFIEKGIGIHSGPFKPNEHVEFFYIMDPDGLKVQFVMNS